MERTHRAITSFLIGGALSVCFGILPAIALAASLSFSPSSGLHAVNETFTVNIHVTSIDQTMNAASGVISFPSDRLEAVSLSKTGSVFGLWVQEPTFSNRDGTINFEGVVLNPGFIGANGKVIGITFKTKAAGNASVTFSSASVLANDGKGTNILTGAGGAHFTTGAAYPKIPRTIAPNQGVDTPAAPAISSPTHPDPDQWYARTNATFAWSMLKGTTAIRLLVDRISRTIPTVVYAPPVSSKEITDIPDGMWYLHAELRNANGWGGVSHFRFQIDTKPPEPFTIQFNDGKETDKPRPVITINGKDSLSGTSGHCEANIDNGEWFASNYETNIEEPDYPCVFRLPLQTAGRHTLVVKVLDKAGNSTVASDEFTIKPPEAPRIIDSPQKLVPLAMLITATIIILWHRRRKSSAVRKKTEKEIREARHAFNMAVDLLKEDVREQIKMLAKETKRKPTEEKINKLKRHLDDVEELQKTSSTIRK